MVRGSHSGAPNIGSTVPATCTTQPCADEIAPRHADDIASLQLAEETLRIHSSGFAIGFKSMSKEKTAEWRGGHEPFRQTRQL